MIDEHIVQYIQKIVGKDNVKLSESMKNHTTLRIGGPVDCFVTPTELGQIPQLIQALKTFEIDYYVIEVIILSVMMVYKVLLYNYIIVILIIVAVCFMIEKLYNSRLFQVLVW